MKNLLLVIFLFFAFNFHTFCQSTLFDDSRVSSVYIELAPDSLDFLYTHVLSDHYFKALFIYDYGSGRDTLEDIGFRLRGNTSRYAQKKSFKISFNEYVPGRKYQDVKKINLNGQHNDPTLIREKLFYDTWNNAALPARRTSFVRLFINQEYFGLYTNLEEFDKDWLQRIFDEKSGNLYKCTYPADLVYLGSNQQSYKDIQSSSVTGGRAYDLQTNETEDDYSDLVDLITTLNQSPDTAFARLIEEKLDVDGFLKAFALDVATGNWDDYMYNKNNYFLYHRSDNDKFEFISYDTDNTFGVDWLNTDWATRNCLDWYAHTQPRPLAEKILSVPAFREKYYCYLDTITLQITNPDILFMHIDSLKTLISDAAQTDIYRTLDYGYSMDDFFNGYTQTVDYHTPYGIMPFLETRYAHTRQQLETLSVQEVVSTSPALNVFPNPVHELLTLSTLPSEIDRNCRVIDVNGRQVKSFVIRRNQAESEIQISDLKPGIYLLLISDNRNIESVLFVKN